MDVYNNMIGVNDAIDALQCSENASNRLFFDVNRTVWSKIFCRAIQGNAICKTLHPFGRGHYEPYNEHSLTNNITYDGN